MEASIVVALIMVGIPGIVSLIMQLFKQDKEKKITDADVTEKIAKAAGVLSESFHKQITFLEEDMKDLKKEIRQLRNGINKLITQIKARGEVPCWTPEEDDL